MPGTQAASSPPSHSGCCHRGDTPPGLCNVWVTRAGRAPSHCGAQAQACWGVGHSWGLGDSRAQPDTPAESRSAPPGAHQEPGTPLSQRALPQPPKEGLTAHPDLQMGNLGSASPGETTKKRQSLSETQSLRLLRVTGLSLHPPCEARGK